MLKNNIRIDNKEFQKYEVKRDLCLFWAYVCLIGSHLLLYFPLEQWCDSYFIYGTESLPRFFCMWIKEVGICNSLSLPFLEVSLSTNSILFKTKFTKNSVCVF